jgi:hypothetical protein
MTLYSSVNKGIYGHVVGVQGGGGGVGGGEPPLYSLVMCNQGIYPNIFVGYT